jgi:hypothetical protein
MIPSSRMMVISKRGLVDESTLVLRCRQLVRTIGCLRHCRVISSDGVGRSLSQLTQMTQHLCKAVCKHVAGGRWRMAQQGAWETRCGTVCWI